MGSENLVKKLPNDIGGDAAGKIERVEHDLLPWEKRCHALADVLDFHKIINTEEKAPRSGISWRGDDRQALILRTMDRGIRQYPLPKGHPHARGTRREND